DGLNTLIIFSEAGTWTWLGRGCEQSFERGKNGPDIPAVFVACFSNCSGFSNMSLWVSSIARSFVNTRMMRIRTLTASSLFKTPGNMATPRPVKA
ncbi:MAG TPA: hypothetical protein VMI35_04780, partial [Puia sp.]|nr:hypothetical protein [Puia sp.]